MLTVNELFSGIGAQVAALKRLGIDHKVVGISEIDTAAIQSYERMNGKTKNYGDISKIEKLDYADLWTYSFPCQDLSVAGKKSGISEGTRSGLLLEVERLLEVAAKEKTLPKYLLLENVKNLIGKKFKPDFDRWLNKLSELGYNNYWQVLNAKDYGVPQNRERVFVVSIRKDCDTKGYKFPDKIPPVKKLKDVLESEVDEKYYLPQERVEKLCLNIDKRVSNTIRCGGSGSLDVVIVASKGRNPDNPSSRQAGIPTEQRLEAKFDGCTNTLTTVQKDNYVIEQVGNIRQSDSFNNPTRGRVYSATGISPCLNTMQGGQAQPYILQQPINTCADGTTNALTAHLHKETANDCVKLERHPPATGVPEIKANAKKGCHIRKLTPKECWRLMGFTDEEFNKARGKFLRIENRPVFKVGNDGLNRKVGTAPTEVYEQSNTQLYKQAGNSIVVDVLVAMFKNLNLEEIDV